MTLDRSRVVRSIDIHADQVRRIASKIHQTPELRFEEHRAAAWISEEIGQHGVEVERPIGGLSTALRARIGNGNGPHLAILAEYDALPEIGHACGHNLIAAGALAAFLALADQRDSIDGTIELVGTPAEEGGGGKIKLLDAGVFAGVDAAMMFHPLDRDLVAHGTLANVWLEMRFTGTPSHAALAPWEGNSALTACLDTFRLIDGQRVHFRDGVRVHGFIKNGGQAVNIIPELAIAEFSVRAVDTTELARVQDIVERCARGAAMASGVDVRIDHRRGYKNMITNLPMARRFGDHLRSLGRKPVETDPSVGMASTDMGDISHALPSIHPWVAICKAGEATCHQHAFAEKAGSVEGQDAMLHAAKAMALTAADLLLEPELLEAAKIDFQQKLSV